jgi:hypothetical protein
MDESTNRFFTRILYVALAAGAVLLCFNRPLFPALALYAFFAAVTLWAHRNFYEPEFRHPRGKLFLFIELMLALAIQAFDYTGFVGVYLFIVIGDALLAYGLFFSLPFALLSLASYAGCCISKRTASLFLFWKEIDASLIAGAVYAAVMINAKHNIAIGHKNRLLAQALKKQTDELQRANDALEAYARELERTADVRVREKLMQELHNRWGIC